MEEALDLSSDRLLNNNNASLDGTTTEFLTDCVLLVLHFYKLPPPPPDTFKTKIVRTSSQHSGLLCDVVLLDG